MTVNQFNVTKRKISGPDAPLSYSRCGNQICFPNLLKGPVLSFGEFDFFHEESLRPTIADEYGVSYSERIVESSPVGFLTQVDGVRDGFCYLLLFKPEYRPFVEMLLGSWPELEAVLTQMCKQTLALPADLAGLKVSYVDSGIHIGREEGVPLQEECLRWTKLSSFEDVLKKRIGGAGGKRKPQPRQTPVEVPAVPEVGVETAVSHERRPGGVDSTWSGIALHEWDLRVVLVACERDSELRREKFYHYKSEQARKDYCDFNLPALGGSSVASRFYCQYVGDKNFRLNYLAWFVGINSGNGIDLSRLRDVETTGPAYDVMASALRALNAVDKGWPLSPAASPVLEGCLIHETENLVADIERRAKREHADVQLNISGWLVSSSEGIPAYSKVSTGVDQRVHDAYDVGEFCERLGTGTCFKCSRRHGWDACFTSADMLFLHGSPMQFMALLQDGMWVEHWHGGGSLALNLRLVKRVSKSLLRAGRCAVLLTGKDKLQSAREHYGYEVLAVTPGDIPTRGVGLTSWDYVVWNGPGVLNRVEYELLMGQLRGKDVRSLTYVVNEVDEETARAVRAMVVRRFD